MNKKIAVKCECGSHQAKRITQEEFDGHDCHLSAEDGCEVCVAWYEQQQEERRLVDEAMLKVQLGNI